MPLQDTDPTPSFGGFGLREGLKSKTRLREEMLKKDREMAPPQEAPLTFDASSRQQLLIYAQELAEVFQSRQRLLRTLSQLEQRMRELAAASIAAQEQERQWIAYEVHDRIAQTLAATFHQLQKLEALTQPDPATRQVAVRASLLVRDAIREARNIMNDLHPPLLDERGLAILMEEELGRLQEETGCRTKLDACYPVLPAGQAEVALYRIFHEALVNIRRHSRAKNITVTLLSRDRVVTLLVQDDGLGFDMEEALHGKPVGGLITMQRRAEIMGGSCVVASRPSQGTRMTVCIPQDGHP